MNKYIVVFTDGTSKYVEAMNESEVRYKISMSTFGVTIREIRYIV